MRIVLAQLPHARKPSQRPCCFVSMQYPLVEQAIGQIAVTVAFAAVNQHVRGAVHRFERAHRFSRFALNDEHILLEMLPMPGGFPEATIVKERCAHLLIAFAEIEFPHFFGQDVIDARAFRQPKRATRRFGMHLEQF